MHVDTSHVSFLNVRAVCERCGISRPTLYRLLKGDFPRPCYPGGIKTPRWRSDSIAAWIDRESEASAA